MMMIQGWKKNNDNKHKSYKQKQTNKQTINQSYNKR